ncbi:hypothetical protein ADL27_15040, partial [Streptomyces sp. NRRL F-6602]
PDIPAIHIRVDETKSMPDDVLEGIDFIIEEGRSVNVRVSNTGLRATRDYITAAMDELTPGRIGLRTNNSTELDLLFPGFGAPDMALFTDPGTVVYMSGTKGPYQPTPAKAYATMAEAFPQDSGDYKRMQTLFTDAARSWPAPAPYDVLLGRTFDDEGAPAHGPAMEIPRLTEAILDDDALERAAAQDAAIELAKTQVTPKTNEQLAVELFASIGRPAKPSEVYPLMVKAGYTLSDRTFRDLCTKLALHDKLLKGDDGTYAAPSGEDPSGRVPGSEDDPDGRSNGTHG